MKIKSEITKQQRFQHKMAKLHYTLKVDVIRAIDRRRLTWMKGESSEWERISAQNRKLGAQQAGRDANSIDLLCRQF